MGLLKRLFGGPTVWKLQSLDALVESRPIGAQSIPWERARPSEMVTSGGVAAVVVDKKTLVTLDRSGRVLKEQHPFTNAISAIALDAVGAWVACAEDETNNVAVLDAVGDQVGSVFTTSAPASALALGPDTLYVGTASGDLEAHPLTNWSDRRRLTLPLAQTLFKKPVRVSSIDVSPDGKHLALIIGGAVFQWSPDDAEKADATLEQGAEYMAARFSPDSRLLALAGGHRSIEIKFGASGMQTTFDDVRALLNIKTVATGKSTSVRGEGYWLQNVLWSAKGDQLLLFPTVAPEKTGPWTKAMALHRLDAILGGSSVPDAVTRLVQSDATDSAGFLAPGLLVMPRGDPPGIGAWQVGAEFSPSASPSSAAGATAGPPTASAPEPDRSSVPSQDTLSVASEPTLDAIVVVFNRDFPTSHQFVDEILSQLTTRGRTYRHWMREGTPVRVKTHANAQDQMTVAAMALIEFRRMGVNGADLRRVQFGTFEGSAGVVGSVLSHWSGPGA